jgi:hypothetical protein
MVARLGEAAGFEYRVHPHQLRHACERTKASIRAPCRTISGTGTSSTRCATRNCRRASSRSCGPINRREHHDEPAEHSAVRRLHPKA